MPDIYKPIRDNKHLFGLGFLNKAFYSGVREKLLEVANIMDSMPETYGQDGLSAEDKTVYLRYSLERNGRTIGEWFILEKDMSGDKHLQAFGLVRLSGNYPELGYINIAELHTRKDLKIDLDFKPTSLAAIQSQLAA